MEPSWQGMKEQQCFHHFPSCFTAPWKRSFSHSHSPVRENMLCNTPRGKAWKWACERGSRESICNQKPTALILMILMERRQQCVLILKRSLCLLFVDTLPLHFFFSGCCLYWNAVPLPLCFHCLCAFDNSSFAQFSFYLYSWFLSPPSLSHTFNQNHILQTLLWFQFTLSFKLSLTCNFSFLNI